MKYYKLYLYEYVSRLSIFPQYFFYLKTGVKPEYMKRKLLKTIVKNADFSNAVETGTYLGRSTKILSHNIENVYTVEIKKDLFEFTKRKFRKSSVNFLLGDSEEILNRIIHKIKGRTIFYLDSHTSGGITGKGHSVTPLKMELEMLDKYESISDSVVLIDDAQSINGTNDYPDIKILIDFAKKNSLKIYKTKMDSYLLIGKDKQALANKISTHLKELVL